MNGYLRQDNATTHTVSFSALEEKLHQQLVTLSLWPCRTPHLNPCYYYLWGKYFYGDHIKEDEIGKACNMHRRD
jgi:hypothetical protein